MVSVPLVPLAPLQPLEASQPVALEELQVKVMLSPTGMDAEFAVNCAVGGVVGVLPPEPPPDELPPDEEPPAPEGASPPPPPSPPPQAVINNSRASRTMFLREAWEILIQVNILLNCYVNRKIALRVSSWGSIAKA